MDCPIEECERRDPKKLYARARQGQVTQFTGLSSSYEPPPEPDLRLRTDQLSVASAIDQIVELLRFRKLIQI